MKSMDESNNIVSSKGLINATKWTVIGEAFAKIVSPITTMILARLLSKEVFGIVASISIITSLADLLTDAGFNAYIVQHQFDDVMKKKKTIDICFWSNLGISVLFYILIFVFREKFASLVGVPGYEQALVIASLSLPLTSFSSIEYAVMQKNFKFKRLSAIKIACKLIPLITTVPLALLGLGYWSLIIGTLAGEIVNCVISYILGKYRPNLFYDIKILKEIFSFSSWAYLESILEWLLKNAPLPFVSILFGVAYLGVFKTGLVMILQIITAVYSLYAGVFKSAIAKTQNNIAEFRDTFLGFQKYATVLSIPLGVAVFLFRDTVTILLLGKEWLQASEIIGYYALTGCVSISIGNFYSDSIRAKGKPKYLAIIDFIYLMVLGLLLLVAKQLSFSQFCIAFSLLKLIQPLMQIAVGTKICGIKIIEVLNNIKSQILVTGILCVVVIVLHLNRLGFVQQIISLVTCCIAYLIMLIFLIPERKDILCRILKHKKTISK